MSRDARLSALCKKHGVPQSGFDADLAALCAGRGIPQGATREDTLTALERAHSLPVAKKKKKKKKK